MDDTPNGRSRPRRGVLIGPVAWGLVSFGVALFALAFTVGICSAVGEALSSAGMLVNTPLPPPEMTLHIPEDVRPIFAAVALVGPAIMAGGVTAGRVRWWIGPLLGWLLGAAFGCIQMLSQPTLEGMGVGITFQMIWLATGLTGGLVSAVRRRWNC